MVKGMLEVEEKAAADTPLSPYRRRPGDGGQAVAECACALCVCLPITMIWCCVTAPLTAAWGAARGLLRLFPCFSRDCRSLRRRRRSISSSSDIEFDAAASTS